MLSHCPQSVLEVKIQEFIAKSKRMRTITQATDYMGNGTIAIFFGFDHFEVDLKI